MPVALTVAAMIALHRRFNQAGPARSRQRRVAVMTGVACERDCLDRRERRGRRFIGSVQPRNRVTHERSECLFVHSAYSTASMIPTIAASTAAALRPSASPAAVDLYV